MAFAQILSARIKEARERRGWDRSRLAEAVGSTSRAVTAWEQGKRFPPVETLVAVADALSVGRGWLLGEDPGGSPTAEDVVRWLASEAGRDAVLDGLSIFVRESG